MTILQRILAAIVVAELIAAVAAVGWRVTRPVAPLPDVSRLDDDTQSSLRVRHAAAWSGSADTWSALGDACLGNGFFPHAESCYRRVLEQDPRKLTSRYGLALCLSRTGRTSEAIEQFRQFISVAGRQHAAAAWYQIGRCCLREENAAEAESAFRQAILMPEAEIQLARLLVRTGRQREAQPIVNLLLSKHPTSLHVLELAMRSAQQRLREAETSRYAARLETAAYMFAMSLDVSDIENYRSLAANAGAGVEQNSSPQGDSPRSKYEQLADTLAGSRFGDRRRLLLPTAQAALADGDPQKSLELIDELFEHGQVTPQALLTYGDAYLALEQPADAEQTWQQSLRLRPTAEAHRRLAALYADRDDEPRKTHHAAFASCFAGLAEFRANRRQEALEQLRASAALKPDHAMTWLYLGKTLRQLGKTREASEAFQKCLELEPSNGDALAAVAELHGAK